VSLTNASAATLKLGGAATLGGAGTLINQAGGTMVDLPGNYFSIAVPLDNSGVVQVKGPGLFFASTASVNNRATGTFDDQSDATIGDPGGSCPLFTNQGVFVKSGAGGTTSFQMQLNNAGTVQISEGVLNVCCTYTQTAGSTIASGGSLTGAINIQGGNVQGSIAADMTNTGQQTVVPTASPTTVASYTETAAGNLNELIGGLAPGTQYGQIIVNGNVNLAGNLQVALVNGFIPANGNQFTIIENQGPNTTNGTFTNLAEGATVWDVTHSDRFTISYVGNDRNDVVLTAQQTATTTTVTASVDPSVLNQSVTFTAAVAPQAGSAVPTGTVQFQIDGVNSGGLVSLSGGQASFATSALSVGTHTISALYSGNGNFLASTGTLTQSVLSAQQQNALIVNRVNALVNSGTLSSGNGNALTVKLISATANLNAGNSTAGVNQLNAFINQVTAFQKTGKLSNAQAQGLINAANLAIAAVSGNGAHLMNDSGACTSSTGDGVPVSWAGELLTGTIGVALENADGTPVPSDEQARFDDAIATLDSTFGAYGVDLVDVGAANTADAVVQVYIAGTSPAGDAADGVLGCTFAGQVTLLTGWNWYTGADPAAIEPTQYDFQTIVTHELGHAIGLGHSGDANSVMYAYLAPGAVRRTVTGQDLAVLDSHGDTSPEPLTAAAWQGRRASTHQGLEPHQARPTTPTISSSAPSSPLGPAVLGVASSPEVVPSFGRLRAVARFRINSRASSTIQPARSTLRRAAQALDHRAVDSLLSDLFSEVAPKARGFRE
jgi:hypothetical protein